MSPVFIILVHHVSSCFNSFHLFPHAFTIFHPDDPRCRRPNDSGWILKSKRIQDTGKPRNLTHIQWRSSEYVIEFDEMNQRSSKSKYLKDSILVQASGTALKSMEKLALLALHPKGATIEPALVHGCNKSLRIHSAGRKIWPSLEAATGQLFIVAANRFTSSFRCGSLSCHPLSMFLFHVGCCFCLYGFQRRNIRHQMCSL